MDERLLNQPCYQVSKIRRIMYAAGDCTHPSKKSAMKIGEAVREWAKPWLKQRKKWTVEELEDLFPTMYAMFKLNKDGNAISSATTEAIEDSKAKRTNTSEFSHESECADDLDDLDKIENPEIDEFGGKFVHNITIPEVGEIGLTPLFKDRDRWTKEMHKLEYGRRFEHCKSAGFRPTKLYEFFMKKFSKNFFLKIGKKNMGGQFICFVLRARVSKIVQIARLRRQVKDGKLDQSFCTTQLSPQEVIEAIDVLNRNTPDFSDPDSVECEILNNMDKPRFLPRLPDPRKMEASVDVHEPEAQNNRATRNGWDDIDSDEEDEAELKQAESMVLNNILSGFFSGRNPLHSKTFSAFEMQRELKGEEGDGDVWKVILGNSPKRHLPKVSPKLSTKKRTPLKKRPSRKKKTVKRSTTSSRKRTPLKKRPSRKKKTAKRSTTSSRKRKRASAPKRSAKKKKITLQKKKLSQKELSKKVSESKQTWKRGTRAQSASGYKGVQVMKNAHSTSFRSKVVWRGVYFGCGTFDTPEKAARAYDMKLMEISKNEVSWEDLNFKKSSYGAKARKRRKKKKR